MDILRVDGNSSVYIVNFVAAIKNIIINFFVLENIFIFAEEIVCINRINIKITDYLRG